MQTHDLGHDIAPRSAQIRGRRVASVAHPPVESEQSRELPQKMQREQAGKPGPNVTEEPPEYDAGNDRPEQAQYRQPPRLRCQRHTHLHLSAPRTDIPTRALFG